jgi:hypothetical protein
MLLACLGGRPSVSGCGPADLDWRRTPPRRESNEAIVPAPRAAVYEGVGGEPNGWKDWFPGFSSGWYEGEPGVGAIRVVKYQGTTFRETILAWDEPTRWTFRVDSSTVPLASALVEDWTFEDAPRGTLARWSFAYEPSLLGRVIAPLQIRTMRRIFQRAMHNLGERLA